MGSKLGSSSSGSLFLDIDRLCPRTSGAVTSRTSTMNNLLLHNCPIPAEQPERTPAKPETQEEQPKNEKETGDRSENNSDNNSRLRSIVDSLVRCREGEDGLLTFDKG